MIPPLLLEIGCEEIPARMIRSGAAELRARLVAALDQAGLSHGSALAWGGSRRLAVRVDSVQARQDDREEEVLGPPAKAAFTADGSPTAAAVGFARKHGADPTILRRIDTGKGEYAGFSRSVRGRSLAEVLAASVPAAAAAMPFPKTMRWADGTHRWVRPVHWIVALHGSEVLDMEMFGVRSGRLSSGHRFLSGGAVQVLDADRYPSALRDAHVVVDPDERKTMLANALRMRAGAEGGELLEDAALLEEVVDLVEWPGVVTGRFDDDFLQLPREILVTTLRHHQKCFSVQDGSRLLSTFLAVANTDRDPKGHIRRGNEWVVTGRLQDARFFWNEDRKAPLAARSEKLASVLFHARCGTYADKAVRIEEIAGRLARRLGLDTPSIAACREAARLAKNDLTTGLVGEFPELQGVVGGLILRAEGSPEAVHRGVYEHYRPAGSEDSIPDSICGGVVAVADKLDTVSRLVAAGETPSGSRDPHGLRRAVNGVYRIVDEREWMLAVRDLADLGGVGDGVGDFLRERLLNYLREHGYAGSEIQAVLRPRVDPDEWTAWPVPDVTARLQAIKTVRGRADFEHLVDLTKRVDNILTKGDAEIRRAKETAVGMRGFVETEPAALALAALVEECTPLLLASAQERRYRDAVEVISRFIGPVERFFTEVLVLDPGRPDATMRRTDLLSGLLRTVLTSAFDIRELAGQSR